MNKTSLKIALKYTEMFQKEYPKKDLHEITEALANEIEQAIQFDPPPVNVPLAKKTFGDGQRVDDLIHIMQTYGIYVKNIVVISLWEMAFNINNTWKTEHFISKGRFEEVREHNGQWAIEDYELSKLFEPIITTLLFTNKIELKRGKNNLDYFVAKSSL